MSRSVDTRYLRSIIESEDSACVFVDDSGSQGQRQNIPHLPDDRFSWVGVVIPPRYGGNVFCQMDECLQWMEEKYDARELHFSDILGGKGAWKGVDFEERIQIFRAFSYIISKEKFPIINQTLWPGHSKLEDISNWLPVFAGKDKSDPKFCSLALLLLKILLFLWEQGWKKAIIVVDEGIQKAGSTLIFENSAPFFKASEVWFASSEMVPPLQLADFAAYSLNRAQVLTGKEKKTNADIEFLLAFESMANCYSDVKVRRVEISRD